MNECFVIMPFGTKKSRAGDSVNFDHIYTTLISPAIAAAGLMAVRGDRYHGEGGIMETMMQKLAEAPVALVDATFHNPNAFYELGVRHAFRRNVTIAIVAEGNEVPYDVRDVPFFHYRLDGAAVADLDATIANLEAHIRQCVDKNSNDSPVLSSLKGILVAGPRGNPLRSGESILYTCNRLEQMQVGIRTGDLIKVKDVDGWVNSENDMMLMARPIERSISSTIRYHGAQRDAAGLVIKDQIALNLASAVQKLTNAKRGTQPRVELGTVLNTSSGALKKSNHVKRIFHLASVRGEYCKDFKPGDDLAGYVRSLVLAVEIYNQKAGSKARIRSLLVPIFGAGQGRGDPGIITDQLVTGLLEGVDDLARTGKPRSLARIEFLAHSTRELFALEGSLAKHARKGNLRDRTGPPAATVS